MTKPTLTTPQPGVTSNRFHVVRIEMEQQPKVCNAAAREPLSIPKWEPARRGADDFRRYKSRGF